MQVPLTTSLSARLLAPSPLTQPSNTENSPFFIKLSADTLRLQTTAVWPEELELLELEELLEELLPLLDEDELLLAGAKGTIAGIKLPICTASVFKLPAASAPSARARSTPQAVPAQVLRVGLEKIGN